jgi:type IV secretory pathway TraG/TraD family ATPase VirD4
MVAIYCGNKWNPKSGRKGAPLAFDLESNFELVAPPGSGKGASLEIPNLLVGLRKCSVLSIDPSGQNAAVCAEARRLAGNDALSLNPMGLHVARYPDLESVGCNPMWGIGWPSVFFYQDCAAIGEALIKLENDAQNHFPQSARGLVTGLVMWEVLKAARRAPLLENVGKTHHPNHPSKRVLFERSWQIQNASAKSRLIPSQNTFLISASQKARVRLTFERVHGD